MPHYIAFIADKGFRTCCHGVSFPDLPGVHHRRRRRSTKRCSSASEVLIFSAEDWTNADGSTGCQTAPRRSISYGRTLKSPITPRTR